MSKQITIQAVTKANSKVSVVVFSDANGTGSCKMWNDAQFFAQILPGAQAVATFRKVNGRDGEEWFLDKWGDVASSNRSGSRGGGGGGNRGRSVEENACIMAQCSLGRSIELYLAIEKENGKYDNPTNVIAGFSRDFNELLAGEAVKIAAAMKGAEQKPTAATQPAQTTTPVSAGEYDPFADE